MTTYRNLVTSTTAAAALLALSSVASAQTPGAVPNNALPPINTGITGSTPSGITGSTPSGITGTTPSVIRTTPLDSGFGNPSASGGASSIVGPAPSIFSQPSSISTTTPTAPAAPASPQPFGPRICPIGMTVC